MRLFSRPQSSGSSALKSAAVTALSKVETGESESERPVMVVPELPDMEVASINLTYYTDAYPTQEQLKAMTDYLEVVYELRCQYANVDVHGGKSWTDPNTKFTVSVHLRGKK